MELVNSILEKEAKKAEKYKSINVEKLLDVDLDVGTLLASDTNDLDSKQLNSKKDEYLKSLTRDNIQLLLNRVWDLETERIDEAIVVRLPEPTFVLPRAKPVPKPRVLTKWEEFAKAKGITKKKRDKLSWDEQLQKWVPLYGYKRAEAEKDKNWVIEVPQNLDPMTDMFEKKANEKSEKVAKNELKRLKNLARVKKVKIPRVGLPVTSDKATATQLATAATVARSSTASVGKFQDRLPKEKDARGISEIVPGSDKKRRPPVPDHATEKQNNLNLIDTIMRKKPKIDMEKAVSKQLHENQSASYEAPSRPKFVKGGKGKKKEGVAKPSKAISKKPKAGAGQRNPGKRNPGRKRR